MTASLPRRIAASVLPESAKRLHERWSVSRRRREIAAPRQAYLERHGRTVRYGPFAGMEYPPELDGGNPVSKLLGRYEPELLPVVQEWIAARHPHIVNVGSAEGYYAVGFARALPGAVVHAFDIEPRMREFCSLLARENGVAERVRVGDRCTPEELAALPESGVALLADCEGCEGALLDPERSPRLRQWPICVELHEFIDPAIAETVLSRFRDTHRIELIAQRPLVLHSSPPELEEMSERERFVLLDEFRPARMRWAVLRPGRG